MALLALLPPTKMESTFPIESDAPGLPQVLDAFAEVIEAIDSDTTLDEILHLVARKICQLVDCSRCGVYLKHSETGLYRGYAIESSQHDADGRIRRLICGTTADKLTQEILATREPVLVRNAQDDPRTVRSIMRSFAVRSILGVPMLVREDVVGILYLDNEQSPHPFSDEHQSVASTFAQLAGVAIRQAQRSAELRSNLKTIARQNELLRHSTAIEERLTRLVLEGGTLADIAKAAAELTGKPCAIHDASYRRLAVSRPAGSSAPLPAVLDKRNIDLPQVAEALASLQPGRPGIVAPVPSAGLLHRSLVFPVALHGECWGYLVLMEFGSRFTALDTAVSRRAGTAIAFELAVEKRAAVADRHEQEALVRDLVNGLEDRGALVRRAELLGFRLESPHVVTLLSTRDGRALQIADVEKAWQALGLPEPMYATTVPHGDVAVVLELDEAEPRPLAVGRAKQIAERLRTDLSDRRPVFAAISGVCVAPADYEHAYTEASRILRCLVALRGTGEDAAAVLAADDLGAGRLMLDMVEREEADRFTRNTLGPLLDSGNRVVEELLVTVRVFLDNGRSVRNSARSLSVHENTIRYRLGRVLELTGLDVGTDSDAQLTVQVAMLILKIQGRLPAGPFPPAAPRD